MRGFFFERRAKHMGPRANSRFAGLCHCVKCAIMAVVLGTSMAELDARSRAAALLFDSADRGGNKPERFEVLAFPGHLDRAAVSRFAFRPGLEPGVG